MEIVDMQLHEPGPFLSWNDVADEARRAVLTETLYEMMDAVGVDAVALHPAEDDEWALQLAQAEPERFVSIPQLGAAGAATPLRRDATDIEDQIAKVAETPGIVAIRFVPSAKFFPDEFAAYQSGSYDRAFAACESLGLPALIMVSGNPDTVGRVAAKFPELPIVLDHIGISQLPMEQPDDPRWRLLPDVLALAQYPNVSVKLCDPPGLSEQSYPFHDIWPHIHKLLGAFGAERLAWASDIGRFRGRIGWNIRLPQDPFVGKHTYMESLAFFLYTDELSIAEKEQILGRSARRMLKWPATVQTPAPA